MEEMFELAGRATFIKVNLDAVLHNYETIKERIGSKTGKNYHEELSCYKHIMNFCLSRSCSSKIRPVLLDASPSSTFGIPRVMGAIISLGCNWWKNMDQIDA